MSEQKKILLHVCCAPCASASIERLQAEGWEVLLYYSNSNIDTHQEYQQRLSYVAYLAKSLDLTLVIDPYQPDVWKKHTNGMEDEPERGKRCRACFGFSFQRTSLKAKELGIPFYCSTLSISPHKESAVLKSVGEQDDNYLHYDFKKQDGYKRSLELSRLMGLYRQNYCGCPYSKRQAEER